MLQYCEKASKIDDSKELLKCGYFYNIGKGIEQYFKSIEYYYYKACVILCKKEITIFLVSFKKFLKKKKFLKYSLVYFKKLINSRLHHH